jgi:hypothetical protein
MKNRMILVVFIVMSSLAGICQDTLSGRQAPQDKSVIYFVRTSSVGSLINFTYFDSAAVIAKCSGKNYVRYECKSRYRLFWGRSENKDFIEAEVEAGKIYFIEVIAQMGFVKAALELRPVDPSDKKAIKRISKLINKKEAETFTEDQLEKETINFKDVIERGLEKYKEEKAKVNQVKQLEKTNHL